MCATPQSVPTRSQSVPPSSKRDAGSSEALGGSDQFRCALRPGFRQASNTLRLVGGLRSDDAGGSEQGAVCPFGVVGVASEAQEGKVERGV